MVKDEHTKEIQIVVGTLQSVIDDMVICRSYENGNRLAMEASEAIEEYRRMILAFPTEDTYGLMLLSLREEFHKQVTRLKEGTE